MIPEYDPAIEKCGKPKETIKEVRGIIIGRGGTQQVVDPETVFKLAELGCNNIEIADWFGVTEQSLRYSFNEYMKKARASLKLKLRRAQFDAAFNGNSALLIFLGKQYLGQSDSPYTKDDDKILPWTTDIVEETEETEEL